MSMQAAASLLQQYNKKSPYKRNVIDSKADQSNKKFGTWSYANMYDALYEKYSLNKNFNVNMWHDAIKLGEQDQYLAFLEQNKDNTLSKQFYDPQYYDYEAMMMEMYLPFADNTKLEKYTQDVYDPASGKWVTEDLGEMTQRQYYEYLLSNTRTAQEQQITKDLEQWRKDQLGWWGQFGHDTLATLSEFGEGLLSGLAGIIDFVAAVGTGGLLPYAMNGFEGNYLDAFVDYFGENGLTAAEKRTVRTALDEYERTHTHFRDIDGNMTGVGKYVAGIANSIGMMVPAIVANCFTGGTASLAWMGTATFYTSIFSNNMYENANNLNTANSPSWLKITNAAIKTGVEAVIEWGLGKILGGTIQNQMIGIGGRNISQGFIKDFSKMSGLKYLFKSAGQEGLEEFLQDFSTDCVDKFTDLIYEGYGNTGVTFQTLIDSFCIGALSSIFMSGGHVALNAMSSAATNAKAKRLDTKDGGHRYNTELGIGPGDLVIETKDGPKKVTGLNRLYYSSILSDFQKAVDELKRGKINSKKNIGLAKEVYGAVSAISQFYSSFDAVRIKNCELLLDRVVKAEKFKENHERAASILTEKTIKKATQYEVKKAAQTFAALTEKTFRSMVGGVALRHAEKLRAATEKVEEKLTKEGGVTTTTGAVDADGIQYKRDPQMLEAEERLGKKGMDVLDELRKGYEWVIMTDGHIACETGDMNEFLFVSEAWLKNYSANDIYKYLAQTKVLETLATEELFAPMVKKLIAFDKEFTGQTDVNAERALMDFLFNKSVYQAFLLSNAGKNMHEFETFIFQFHEIMQDIASKSKYHQQLFKGKQSQKRINMLNQIYEQIKETMREPTLKAILNWHIPPQSVHADSVLTPRDRQVINQYENWRRTLNGTGTDRSAYENLAEDIIARAHFNDKQLALIRKSLDGTATIDEDIEARALLEEADRRMTIYDFEVSPTYSYYSTAAERLNTRLKNLSSVEYTESTESRKSEILAELIRDINWYVDEAIADAPGYMDSRNLGTEAGIVERTIERINEILEEYKIAIDANSDISFLLENIGDDGSLETLKEDIAELTRLLQANADILFGARGEYYKLISDTRNIIDELSTCDDLSEKLRESITNWYKRSFDSGLFKRGADEDLNIIVSSGIYLLREYCAEADRIQIKHNREIGLGTFTIPYQVAAIAMNDGDIAAAQFITDKLDEFKSIYGISARQMIMGDLSGMSMAQRNQLTQDMEILDINNITLFVIKKLEGMLGGKYIITPKRSQYKLDGNDTDTLSNVYDFVIAKSIPAERFISQDILNEDIKTRNQIFRRIFTSTDVYNRQVFRTKIADALKNDVFKDYRKELEYLSQLSDLDVDNWFDTFIEYNNGTVDIINPLTGEVLTDTPMGYLFAKIRDEIRTALRMLPLSTFIDISAFPTIDLADVYVYFEDAGEGNNGYTIGNKIVIDPRKSNDYFGTLVHEVNHVLQSKTNMPGGFNTKTASAMPDFLAYVANHYPDFVQYTLYRAGYGDDIEIIYGKDGNTNITKESLLEMPTQIYNLIAHCGYMLVQGELWARAYTHNGKPVHGFAAVFGIRGNYLLAPDGKTKFKVISDTSDTKSTDETSYISDVVAGSALDTAIQKLFLLKSQQERRGYAATSRNTYHSGFTKSSSLEMTRRILSPYAPPLAKYTVKLGDIIRDPQSYLAPEILAMCKGDFSEGNVFYRIKEYVEANVDGVSIDITAGPNPQYVWVDDNAFDDLLLTSMKSKVESQESTLATKYKAGEHIPLTEFYSAKELARLGVNPSAYIVISPSVATETVFDDEHRTGAIFIKANENTTDAKIIDSLNHEFRHLLQHYNGFATGFTPNFKVSREMIEDVKKHVPGLFKNNTIVRWAKALADIKANTTWEEVIVQRFVYYTTSGELNAYAFNARDLYAKPTFVNKEAGNPVIFMPWYDAKTGEGRYRTEYLAMRAEDTEAKPKGAKVPNVNKRPKYAGVKVESLDDVDKVRTYVYNVRRDFTAKKAKGTNLEYFVKKGQRNQMDPDLQEFVIATTGHEDQLPAELVNAIKKGILTKQALFKWFRQVKTVNEFTFDLLNKYMFKNNYITSMAELDAMLTVDPSFYWAAAIVLRKEGIALEALLADNDVDKFLSFINSLEGTKWKTKIEKLQAKFGEQWISDGKGSVTREYIGYSDKVQAYMRVLAMQWFDGTLAGAFYTANAFRKVARKYEEEARGVTSIDVMHGNDKGDKDVTLADRLTEDDAVTGDNRAVANDILAIYEGETNVSEDDMIQELSMAYYEQLCKEAGLDPQSKSKEKLMPIAQKVIVYQRQLQKLSIDEIVARYAELKSSQMTDTKTAATVFDADSKQYKNTRVNIVARIKRTSTALLKLIREGKVAFSDLPKEVQDMFELTTATTDSGKKTEVYELKADVYSVGRGRKKLPGATDKTSRFNYAPKHNITEGNEAFRHDVSAILANDDLLRNTLKAVRQEIARRKGTVKKMVARGERAAQSLVDAIRSQKVPREKQVKTTEFKVTPKKKKRTSDTPNVFNIMSGIDMPHVLYKILDTSFEDMANTEVQFASRDENGQLYDKSQFKPGEFNSRVKHEVSNWDAFYEANRDALLSLSRNDVLDIIEFFQRGALTMDGPANKLAAFEIFLLGYIVDAARHNINNWNFSDAEIEMVEKLYEQKASAYGSGLQAVQQMLKVVDPMKKVRQRMFDDWTEISDDDKNKLIKAVDNLQTETNADERKKKAAAVIEMLGEFGKRQEIIPRLKHISTMLRKLIDAGTIELNALPNDVQKLLSMGDVIAIGDLNTLIERDKTFDTLLRTNREFRRLIGPEIPRWSKAWWARLGSQIKSWRYMAMLSGPTTWIRNVISNLIVTGLNKTSDLIGGIIFTKKGYRKDQWNLAGTKISSEAKSFIDAYILNNPIFNPTKKDIKNGASNLYDLSSKYDARQSKKVADERGLLVTLIAKAYEKQYAQGRRFDRKTLNILAKFIDKMISDKKFVKFAAGRYFGKILTIEAKRGNVDLSQGLSSEVMDLFAESVILANIEYMHKRSFAADFLDGIRDKYPAMYEALTFWQPFLNSSFNWFAESFKYTGFGLIGSIARMWKLENQITKLSEKRANGEMVADSRATEFFIRRDIGKGVVGLILSTLGIMLALSGRIRIDEDDDKFYLYVDEEIKLDITSLFGSSSVLVGASVAQRWIEQSDGEPATAEEVISLVTDAILDGFFVTDILERHKWGGTWDDLLTETESVMRSFVPQMWQTIIACTNQHAIRYSPGFKGMWERWLNTFVPTQPFGNRKINPYTGELEDKYSLPIVGALLQKGVLGPKIYWVEVSELERMCRELGVNKNELTGELTVNGEKFELDRLALNKKYGELNKESLEKIKSQKHKVEMPDGTFKTLSWDKMNDEQRARVISRTMTQNAEIAKIYIWTQTMGKKFYASVSLWQMLKRLGITRNVYKGDKGFVE